jgi:hypothetical protein
MDTRRDHLKSELSAMLAAGKDLPSDNHPALVDAVLGRLETEHLLEGPSRLRALLDEWVPVSVPGIVSIALAHGLTLLVLGKVFVEGVMGTSSYYQDYWPAWMMLGLIWLIEVAVTLVTISVLFAHRGTAPRATRRRARR